MTTHENSTAAVAGDAPQVDFDLEELDACIMDVCADCVVHYPGSPRLLHLMSQIDREEGARDLFRLAVTQAMTIAALLRVATPEASEEVIGAMVSPDDSDALIVLRSATLMSLSRDSQISPELSSTLADMAMSPTGLLYQWVHNDEQ